MFQRNIREMLTYLLRNHKPDYPHTQKMWTYASNMVGRAESEEFYLACSTSTGRLFTKFRIYYYEHQRYLIRRQNEAVFCPLIVTLISFLSVFIARHDITETLFDLNISYCQIYTIRLNQVLQLIWSSLQYHTDIGLTEKYCWKWR